jgi:hypothetical protein
MWILAENLNDVLKKPKGEFFVCNCSGHATRKTDFFGDVRKSPSVAMADRHSVDHLMQEDISDLA